MLSKGAGLVGSIICQEVEREFRFRHVDFVDLLHAEKFVELDLKAINVATERIGQGGLLDA